MSDLKTRYCKMSDDHVAEIAISFMKNKSKLSSVSVSEIAYHSDFNDLFEDFVGERRRWLELGKIFERQGWTHKRVRSLFYGGDDNYTTKVTARWFPPSKED